LRGFSLLADGISTGGEWPGRAEYPGKSPKRQRPSITATPEIVETCSRLEQISFGNPDLATRPACFAA